MNDRLKRWCIWTGIIIVVVLYFWKPVILKTVACLMMSLWLILWGILYIICAFINQGLITAEIPPRFWERIILLIGGISCTFVGIALPFRNSGYYIIEIIKNILLSVMSVAVIVSYVVLAYHLVREYYTAQDNTEKYPALFGIIALILIVIEAIMLY